MSLTYGADIQDLSTGQVYSTSSLSPFRVGVGRVPDSDNTLENVVWVEDSTVHRQISEIWLRSPSVSKTHGRFDLTTDHETYTDMSTNGTRFTRGRDSRIMQNGQTIDLKNGDELYFRDTEGEDLYKLTFRILDGRCKNIDPEMILNINESAPTQPMDHER